MVTYEVFGFSVSDDMPCCPLLVPHSSAPPSAGGAAPLNPVSEKPSLYHLLILAFILSQFLLYISVLLPCPLLLSQLGKLVANLFSPQIGRCVPPYLTLLRASSRFP